MLKTYSAEIEDDNFEIILAENDEEAINKYLKLEDSGHVILELAKLDEDYNVIRIIL